MQFPLQFHHDKWLAIKQPEQNSTLFFPINYSYFFTSEQNVSLKNNTLHTFLFRFFFYSKNNLHWPYIIAILEMYDLEIDNILSTYDPFCYEYVVENVGKVICNTF